MKEIKIPDISPSEAISAADYAIGNINPAEAEVIYQELEQPNWAPWLEASPKIIAGRAKVFPEGQLIMKGLKGEPMAMLSLNQINWNGEENTLPTWDTVAGEPTDYSTTYQKNGNTLVLLSMNVSSRYKGMHLPGKMIDAAANLGGKLKVDHLIGSFRPSEFGKLKPGLGWDMDFWEYCLMKKSYSDKPIDHWLGSLWHKGMKMLAPDYQAMAVQVSLEEFESYKQTYQPDMWQEIKPKVWECGEVGTWYVQADYAEYIESNVWGELPIK